MQNKNTKGMPSVPSTRTSTASDVARRTKGSVDSGSARMKPTTNPKKK